MKICLINPPCTVLDDANLEPPLGLLYIAAVLRENNYNDIKIYTMTDCKNIEEVKNKIENIPEADIYGFTVYCTNYNYTKMCINYIKNRNSNSIIILGGPNASALPEFTLKDSGCDYVITGEGEDAFSRAVYHIEFFGYGDDILTPRIIEGKGREDLDTIPFPAWDLIDLHKFNRTLNGERVISIISSRGCPNKCVHCNSIIMGAGRKIRYRSTDNVIREIKYLQSLGYTNFRFSDDNFTIRPNLGNLLSELKKLNIKYRVFARIEQLTEENCKLLSESGCKLVSIGLESLNPDNLKFLRKQAHKGLEHKHLQNVRNSGMTSRIYFMMGLPYDTDETIEKYFKEAMTLVFDEFIIYPLIPYPGTLIAQTPEKFGYTITNMDFTTYIQIGSNRSTCYVLQHKNFTTDDVERWHDYVTHLLETRGRVHMGLSGVAK